MITPIMPPIHNKVEKVQVSEKDPHHEVTNDKEREENNNKKKHQPEDEIILSSEQIEENKSDKDKKLPENPMQGHIDISV